MTIPEALQTAYGHQQSGRFSEAESIYREILSQSPQEIDALVLLGILCTLTGRSREGIESIRKAIQLRPNDPQIHNSLANALRSNGNMEEALAEFDQAICLKADFPEAHLNRSNLLNDLCRFDEAILSANEALRYRADYAEALNSLGIALAGKGEFDEAIAAYGRAIALNPNLAQVHNNLGGAFRNKGLLDEAITAYQQAIALNPNMAEVHYNLSIALSNRGKLDEAIAAAQKAIELRADYPEAIDNLGIVLKDQGKLDEALAAYRRAIALRPSYAEAHSDLILTMHYHPAYSAKDIAEEEQRWNLQHAEPLRKTIHVHSNNRDSDRPLRIGYVSPDFRDHVVGRSLLPLFQHHDREQFKITAYSQSFRSDPITEALKHNSQWRNIYGVSDQRVAEQIWEDQIDILVDLSMHVPPNRLLLFARKPAPVQVTWLGYPGSTGLRAMDYRLSDPYLDPPGMDESLYSEKTVRLPHTFWCYDPLESRGIRVNSLPALERGFVTFGCLNNFCKVNEVVLALWSKVLREATNSRLVMFAPQGSARQATLKRFELEGIQPDRIEFVADQTRQKYFEVYRRIDIGLNTFPFNGGITTCDSMWMGVPVITTIGQTAVGRAGWTILSNVGLGELAGRTPEEFVRIALELAGNPRRLNALRSTLRQRMEHSALMDAARFARDIESAYRKIWREWCTSTA